jgi:hypothetical protein
MASLVGLAFIVPVLLLGVLVLVGAVVASGRTEPDPNGERPLALYLAATAFITVFLALGAFSTIIGAAVDAGLGDDTPTSVFEERGFSIGPDGDQLQAPDPILPSGSGDERDNERIRTIVIAGLVLAAAGGLFLVHDGRLNDFRNTGRSPGWRTAQVEGYVVCFLALLTALGAVVAMGYSVFQAIAPGIAGVAERDDALQPGIVSAVVTIAAAGVFWFHWTRLDRRGTGGDSRLAEVVAPLPPPPPPPPPPPAGEAPRVRRRPLRVDDPPG